MTKAKYLRIVGYIELISSLIAVIVGLIYMIALSMGVEWALEAAGAGGSAGARAVTGFALFLGWVLFFGACFFAPAVGVLFLSVADLLDEKRITSNDVSSIVDSRLDGIYKRIKKVEQNIEPQKKDSKKEEAIVAATVEPDNKSEGSPAEEVDKVVNNSSDDQRRTFTIDTVVKFKEDMLVDGVQIKQGETGVIVDILRGFAGRQYAVILGESKERVLVREDCFE